MRDSQLVDRKYQLSEIDHKYGENVHILSNPFSDSALARFSSGGVVLPELNYLNSYLYQTLLEGVIGHSFPTEEIVTTTRMADLHKEGRFAQKALKFDQPVVCVDLARAGTNPSQHCFHTLNHVLNPEGLRQDHFYVNRKVDENEQVIGVDVSGSKIGGGVKDAVVLLPDPMGATGGSMCFAIDHYKKEVEGRALKYITMHLIITPEYIKRVTTEHPDVEIYALRLDRGLSDQKALDSIPGEYPELEKGLNSKQYIIPGAGGVGEILNNSFV